MSILLLLFLLKAWGVCERTVEKEIAMSKVDIKKKLFIILLLFDVDWTRVPDSTAIDIYIVVVALAGVRVHIS